MTKKKQKKFKPRNPIVQEMLENPRPGGPMHNREHDIVKGRSRKPKHKKAPVDEDRGL